jgi:hypothetical protein
VVVVVVVEAVDGRSCGRHSSRPPPAGRWRRRRRDGGCDEYGIGIVIGIGGGENAEAVVVEASNGRWATPRSAAAASAAAGTTTAATRARGRDLLLAGGVMDVFLRVVWVVCFCGSKGTRRAAGKKVAGSGGAGVSMLLQPLLFSVPVCWGGKIERDVTVFYMQNGLRIAKFCAVLNAQSIHLIIVLYHNVRLKNTTFGCQWCGNY